MTFDWSQYLNLAKELLGQPTTPANQEARFRATIHLSYYAAFTLARNHLRDKEGYSIPTTGDVHKYVSDQFRLSSGTVRQDIARKLNYLRRDRNKADYSDSVANLSAKSRSALKQAQRIISRLSSL